MTAKEDFISELDGSFFVTVEGRAVEPRDVQKMLASFGELASFSASGSDPCDQVCTLSEGMHASQLTYRPCVDLPCGLLRLQGRYERI